MRDVPQYIEMYATDADGQERTFTGTLPPGQGYLIVGQKMSIRVDRNNPAEWTDRREVTPWSRDLVVSIMFLPVIVALLAAAWFVRRKILRVWENGVPIEGTVVDLRPLGVGAHVAAGRYTLAGSRDRRIFSALAPKRDAPARGEPIQLLMPSDGATKPTILARLYQQHG
jgi:hypothetical protein